jgi:predicted unusual protein kinase regulating ubiquinone biosynthesis (AarF/ABC1/UbiB family)
MAGIFYNTWYFITECTRLYRIHRLLRNLHDAAASDALFALILEGGSIYIKFAQWYISHLAYDPAYAALCARFATLFETCPSQSLDASMEIYAAAIGRDMADDIYMDTVREIGSGSIGTVYYAKQALSGRELAIKIKHPHINAELAQKRAVIAILKRVQRIGWLRSYFRLCFSLDDFINNIYMQADLTNEARNMERMRANLAGNRCVRVPEVIYSAADVLVTEYVETEDIGMIGRYEKNMVAINMVALIYQMCLVDNFVHGDLHYKNWKIHRDMQSNILQIVLFDMGICFSFNDDIAILAEFWAALEDCNIAAIITILKKMCSTPLTTSHDMELEKMISAASKNHINSFDILRELVSYFTDNNLQINQYVVNIVIMICLVEKFLKTNGFIQEETARANIFAIIRSNRLDIISYCKCYNSYPAVQELLSCKLDDGSARNSILPKCDLVMQSPSYDLSSDDDNDE